MRYWNTKILGGVEIHLYIEQYIDIFYISLKYSEFQTLKYTGYYITKICKYSHNLISSLEVCFWKMLFFLMNNDSTNPEEKIKSRNKSFACQTEDKR